jgi:hypothetical protein
MTTWTKEWPTKPGHYWFYGYRFGNDDGKEEKKFYLVEVWLCGKKDLAHVGNGHFWYVSEGHDGLWQPVKFPIPPKF